MTADALDAHRIAAMHPGFCPRCTCGQAFASLDRWADHLAAMLLAEQKPEPAPAVVNDLLATLPTFPRGGLLGAEHLEWARDIATLAHDGQTTKTGEPYATGHVAQVVANLPRDASDTVRVCAWLHDTYEDTDIDQGQVARAFGMAAHQVLSLLTHDPGMSYGRYLARLIGDGTWAHYDAIEVKRADNLWARAHLDALGPADYRRLAPRYLAAERLLRPVHQPTLETLLAVVARQMPGHRIIVKASPVSGGPICGDDDVPLREHLLDRLFEIYYDAAKKTAERA